MKYDFETVLDRRGHDALAVDMKLGETKEGFSLLPMWVADMSFPVVPSVTRAIEERLRHPTYGYFMTSDAYYDAIIRWQKVRHGDTVSRDDIGYENGVLGCLASALRAFTSPGSPVLIHSPTYIGFSRTLKSTGRRSVASSLCRDEKGVWRMDFADMEEKIKENNIHFAVFCSPHNPTGRVWTQEEISRYMELCRKYDITVFSDEIWNDILLFHNHFIPTRTVSDDARNRTVTCCAPSKTFNLAGLIGSYHIIPNKTLRDRFEAESDSTHYNSMNVLSQHALIGAYGDEGMEWTDELCAVLSDNADYACRFITERLPGISLARPEGTYMLFLDLADYLKESGRTLDEVLRAGWEVGVLWQDGRPFAGDSTIRMNVALPHSLVTEAFNRLEKYVFGGK